MQPEPSRSSDLARLLVSCWYALFILGIPGLVFALKIFVHTTDPDARVVPIWRVPVVMPSWYIIGYFCVLVGAVFVLPSAFMRSRVLGFAVLFAMLISFVGMLPIIFVPKLYFHP